MSGDLLQQIQQLQFSEKAKAESLVLDFVRRTFLLDVVTVELRPLVVSLNSFNGFLTLGDNKRLFFKTHTETDTAIGEYYRAGMLAEVGYPVIQPLYSSTQTGHQLLIYEVIDDPSVFDVSWNIEEGDTGEMAALTEAQAAADNQLAKIYTETLYWQSADEASQAAIHQLFYHRLTGGRLERFYGPLPGRIGTNVNVALPGGDYLMQTVRQAKWNINGQIYDQSFDELIVNSIRLLEPTQAVPSVIGHGDAHNGNVFFQQGEGKGSLLFFDPAFAGRHHPLLDIAKPLFHNVFAMWMYFPQVKREETRISFEPDDVWNVQHDYTLHPVREMFLRSKVERVLVPVLRGLQERDWLRSDWRSFLKAALFCCPLLTMNLTDGARFSPEICLLGLTMVIEMGAESRGKRSFLDQLLDEVSETI